MAAALTPIKKKPTAEDKAELMDGVAPAADKADPRVRSFKRDVADNADIDHEKKELLDEVEAACADMPGTKIVEMTQTNTGFEVTVRTLAD